MKSHKSVRGVVLDARDQPEVRRQKMARIILDSMYQFLGLLDVDGNVLEINQAALDGAGLCLADVIGRPFWQARWWAVSDEVRQRVKAMIEEARSGRFVRCDFEVFGDQHGSRTIAIDFSLTPILDDAGDVSFLLPEGRNITEKVERSAELTRKNGELQVALEKLREIDGYKTQFFANVSHELRTPLALILGPVDQLIRDGAALGERDRFRLAAIERNARSLLEQVNNLLDLARIDADRMPMAFSHVDVLALIREIAAGFEAIAEERGIRLAVHGDAALYADVDRAKFVRVVSNLLSNAFKFTPDGGRIGCSAQRLPGDRLLVGVQDTGPGVADAMKQAIFDRFTQGDARLGASGSGLGLNIVKEFVELHRGTVVVVDAPGGGAVFQVELPMQAPEGAYVRAGTAQDAPRLQPPETSAPAQGPASLAAMPFRPGQPRVLVVEDNTDLRLFLHDVLVDEYNVRLEEDGEAALRAALDDPPDLIITDLMMPRCDGEAFIRTLRAAPGFPNVPVLVLSARADDALREKLLDELVQDYLTKPFSPQELRARVRNLVTVKRTVDILQKELNSQASDIWELTASLVESRKSLQRSFTALQVADRRWLGLYENTAVGIALADRDGKIVTANPALQRMLGYAADAITGVSLIALTEASERATTIRNVHGLFDGVLTGYHAQKRYERRDGGLLWANVFASRIPAIAEDGPMLAVIVEDITSRLEAEQSLAATRAELARVSRFTAMGELAASIAHEVNQPLSAITTNSQAALRWLSLPTPNLDEVAAALHRVSRDASLAGAVIARIRKFLRAGEIKREPIDLARLVDELLKMLQAMLAEQGVRVRVCLPAAMPALTADAVQLQQVILNLVVNAVDAVKDLPPARREITLRVADDPAGVRIAVHDDGPGIAPAHAARLFDAFFSTKPDGLGMGLAISRSIIENHGGRLWLDTTEPGACFVFTLPHG
ncbi:ATP-binding protein [Zoogloea sp.]|uniref:ATP-binding protein n=1 Tax=Zoogloea sp. TaxID=49181 RepID=UPI0035AE7A40